MANADKSLIVLEYPVANQVSFGSESKMSCCETMWVRSKLQSRMHSQGSKQAVGKGSDYMPKIETNSKFVNVVEKLYESTNRKKIITAMGTQVPSKQSNGVYLYELF